jgi:fatty-acyl-CoA synthase
MLDAAMPGEIEDRGLAENGGIEIASVNQNLVVRECCIVSAPDGYRGETVKALVVLDDAARATTSPDDVVSWARGAMASYKAPRAVVFVESLPRTASNKINWRLLQDAEWGRTA